jgi:peptidyl-prolyl cis-trans isomerase SurA
LRQIVQYPKPTEAAKETARRRLQSLRERILEGESFSTLAILYSEDEGSASRGGEIGFENRNNLAPAYANTAFKLEVDSVSEVVETKFGLHIIQLLERRGERVNTRHILIKPELDGEARIAVKHKLDSIRNLIRQGKIAFSQAAFRFSEDDETRNNGGLMTTARDNSTKLPADELKAGLYFAVDTMKEGQISPPMPMQGRDGRTAYRLVKLEKRFPPHKASLKLDYPELKRKAEQEQRQAYLDEWMQKQLKQTYLKVMPPYHRCPSLQGLRASGSSAANMPPGR